MLSKVQEGTKETSSAQKFASNQPKVIEEEEESDFDLS